MNNNTKAEENKVVEFNKNDEEIKEEQKEQVRVIDGWNTRVQSNIIQVINSEEKDDTFKLKKTDRVIIPFKEKSTTTVLYQFDTLFGITVEFYLDIEFAKDSNYKPCTVMWLSDTTEEKIKSILKYVNWDEILSSGGSVSGITDRKHVMSFSADAENNTELVEIYVESVINGVNNTMCAVDVNLYAKLTPAGEEFLNGESEE